MKRRLQLITAILLLWLPSQSPCEDVSGNINLVFGELNTARDFSEDFGLDKRFELGISADVKKKDWPVSLAIEYLVSYGDSENSTIPCGKDGDLDIYGTEMYIGVKKILESFSFVRPFAEMGIYTTSMYADTPCDHEYNFGIGPWAGAGFYVPISENFNAGFAWKWSKARLCIFSQHVDSGGNHFNILAGYRFE